MRKTLLLRFVWIAICVLLLGAAADGRQDWEALFFKSNQAYRDGDFEAAAQGYRRLIQSGHTYGEIYYNLGNAYLKADALGMAIWAYEQARMRMPRNADLKYNLAYARDQTLDALPRARSLVDTAFFWLDQVTLAEVFYGFAVLNGLLWGGLLLRLFRRYEWLYYMLILVIPLWGIAGGSFAAKWYQMNSDQRAVVVDETVKVLAGPHPSDTLLFKLHEGAVVTMERDENGWRLIRLPDKKRGWVKSTTLQPLYARAGQDQGDTIDSSP